jgi:energy-coupling factor transport system permease protein
MSVVAPVALRREERESLLGRTSPLTKLVVAALWIAGLAITTDARPGLFLTAAALLAIPLLGEVPAGRVARRLAPLLVAAAGIVLTNLLFGVQNGDPAAAELARLGPIRLTSEAASTAIGLGARVLAIVSVGSAFALTTEATTLCDALVQQAGMSARFAYGALAAYQAVPALASDLSAIRASRRLRGVREWHPRLLVGLLVRAIRRADQLALAMDARGFGSGPRSTYRPIAWAWPDAVVGLGGLGAMVAALLGAR